MGKKYKICIAFFLYAVGLYWLIHYMVQIKIKAETADSGVWDTLVTGIAYSVFGQGIYIFAINLTALIGLIIALRRKDKTETVAFTFLTALTVTATVTLYLVELVS